MVAFDYLQRVDGWTLSADGLGLAGSDTSATWTISSGAAVGSITVNWYYEDGSLAGSDSRSVAGTSYTWGPAATGTVGDTSRIITRMRVDQGSPWFGIVLDVLSGSYAYDSAFHYDVRDVGWRLRVSHFQQSGVRLWGFEMPTTTAGLNLTATAWGGVNASSTQLQFGGPGSTTEGGFFSFNTGWLVDRFNIVGSFDSYVYLDATLGAAAYINLAPSPGGVLTATAAPRTRIRLGLTSSPDGGPP